MRRSYSEPSVFAAGHRGQRDAVSPIAADRVKGIPWAPRSERGIGLSDRPQVSGGHNAVCHAMSRSSCVTRCFADSFEVPSDERVGNTYLHATHCAHRSRTWLTFVNRALLWRARYLWVQGAKQIGWG
jgi:hypothetical protein